MMGDCWVVIVQLPPSEPASTEMLELVLAGASLDLDLTVVFRGAGVAHVAEDPFRPWRQLIDHSLATVLVESGAARLPEGALSCSAAEIDALVRGARAVLVL
ncbi:MAG: hypothetical protein HND55_11225 [Pseudomonadota bacterium]|nr:MAG: hypothetical protein HND55_11225 [Pseudomonadota bacterium]